MSERVRSDTARVAVLDLPETLLLTWSMSASCCMRSARVKGAWMSTGRLDCSIVVVWRSGGGGKHLFCSKNVQVPRLS